MNQTPSVQRIVHVSTNSTGNCPICKKVRVGGDIDFEAGVNHLLMEHRCTLLHVGTETVPDNSHKPWHTTVAVIGIPEDPIGGAI